jgi:predicted esterase
MENKINFDFEARYFTIGKASEEIEQLWFVCHGHGQLAEYFIRKFKCLDNGKTLIVAPEGLSKYYLNGFSGRVGATWMTKEDRLRDIQNYTNYLTSVFKEVRETLPTQLKVKLLGFSQGAATISRFATQSEIQFDQLILWAGIFPPDLPPLQSVERLKNKNVYWVYGTQDQYLSDGIMLEQTQIAQQLKVAPEVISFEGEHELNEKVLIDLSNII